VESIARPLRRLQEEGSWFVRAKEARLLWVTAPASLRGTAVSLLARLEYHADNQSPFVVVEVPWSGPDAGARARSEQFAERFEGKALALREQGIDIGPFSLAPATQQPDLPPGPRWLRDLVQALESLRPPLSGLVVLLAPPRVEEASVFVAHLRALVAEPRLRDVRWVVLECDSRHLAPLLEELQPGRALSVDLAIDEVEQQRDLAALAGPAPNAVAPAVLPHPWGPWSSGGAMPDSVAPQRSEDRLPPSDAQLRAAGLEPAYLKGGAQQLRQLMLRAALALRQGRPADAIDLQTRTAELCGLLNLPREQVIHLLVLGGYLLAAGQPERARATYQLAAQIAADRALSLQQAQAELGLGMLDALEQKSEAAGHYAAAARLAEAGAAPALGIECWRMAGQVASTGHAPALAIECWEHALALAERLAPEARRSTSAADVARLLANAHAARGRVADAEQLHRQAFQLERGVEPGPAEPAG
jgi:tetratricopeptide (TPR) repeat protein